MRRRRRTANIAIVGNNSRGYALCRAIEATESLDLNVIGFVNSWDDRSGHDHDPRVLGDLRELDAVLARYPIDGFIFAVPRRMIGELEPAVRLCETMGIRYWIAADLFSHATGQVTIDTVGGWPLIRYDPTTHRRGALFVKRFLDIVLSATALVAVSPLLAVIAVAVVLSTRGGALFVQTRAGLNGRPFPLMKFRTMVAGAEARLPELTELNEMRGPVFKMADDPRMTPVGRYLRRYYLDELPQLLNVLLGHMSLVGPRPPLPSEVERYNARERRRLCVRPGLTCIWQVSRGKQNGGSFEQWAAMDLEYIDHWSLWLDLMLLLRTMATVLRGTGQ